MSSKRGGYVVNEMFLSEKVLANKTAANINFSKSFVNMLREETNAAPFSKSNLLSSGQVINNRCPISHIQGQRPKVVKG